MTSQLRRIASAIGATVTSVTLIFSLAACGESESTTETADSSTTSTAPLGKLKGVTVKGTPGEKPEATLKTPLTFTTDSYAVVQKGDGAAVTKGQRICVQSVVFNARTGEELQSTWEDNTPDCSIVLNSSITPEFLEIFTSAKINETIAMGILGTDSTDTSSDATTTASDPYVILETIVSASKDPKRATGDVVADIPSNLPKVTLAKDGEPSIDIPNGYKPGKDLVVQTLIKGKGAEVTESQTVKAHYTGWLTDGTVFDSSWEGGEAIDFALNKVVQGWTKGLAGQTVGSQVLLIIPPDLGYGDQEQNGIPKNSTLIFVVDILAAY